VVVQAIHKHVFNVCGSICKIFFNKRNGCEQSLPKGYHLELDSAASTLAAATAFLIARGTLTVRHTAGSPVAVN
jgi:hypothetical protein